MTVYFPCTQMSTEYLKTRAGTYVGTLLTSKSRGWCSRSVATERLQHAPPVSPMPPSGRSSA